MIHLMLLVACFEWLAFLLLKDFLTESSTLSQILLASLLRRLLPILSVLTQRLACYANMERDLDMFETVIDIYSCKQDIYEYWKLLNGTNLLFLIKRIRIYNYIVFYFVL